MSNVYVSKVLQNINPVYLIMDIIVNIRKLKVIHSNLAKRSELTLANLSTVTDANCLVLIFQLSGDSVRNVSVSIQQFECHVCSFKLKVIIIVC